ncbi:MAG TPA: trypsin-like serine protease, partial [Labilithrix sp.]|nr:trypsin-like serine protease [Labilithrix sp.]
KVDRAVAPILLPQRSATEYSEAVRIKVNNAFNDFCSGVIVAPGVVLTASNCIAFNPAGAGARGTWTVTAPFALGGAQVRNVSVGAFETFEPNFTTASGGRSNYDSHPELHDLGLLYVDTPFTGVVYPDLSATQYPIGATHPQVSAVGRQTAAETAGLVLSKAVALSASSDAYTHDNVTPVVTTGGDSGGPLLLEGTHTLVGTETRFSGQAVGDIDYWARLDTNVYAWIAARVAAHGGFNPTLAQFKDDVSAALCARVQSCCAAATPGYTLTASKCSGVYDVFGFEATARGIQTAGAFNVVIDAAAKAACLAKIASNAADCSITSVEVKSAITDCLASVSGRIAVGGACTSSLECTGSAVCERDAAGAGTCKALRTAGQSCEIVYKTGTGVETRDNLAQDLCSKRGGGTSGLYCDAYDFGANAYRPESTWTCKSAVADGGACGTDSYCSSFVCSPFGAPNQFTCVPNASFVTPSVCTAFGP